MMNGNTAHRRLTSWIIAFLMLLTACQYARAGDEACSSGNMCYPQRSYNTWTCQACNFQWRCVNNNTGIVGGDCPCDAYHTCSSICLNVDGGTGGKCKIQEGFLACNRNPGHCEADGTSQNCQSKYNGCDLPFEYLTYGCCGAGGAEPTPQPPPPTNTPIQSCPVTLSGRASITAGVPEAYSAAVFPENGAVDRVEFTVGQTGSVITPGTLIQDTTSPYTQTYTGLSAGTATIIAKCIMGGNIKGTTQLAVTVQMPAPPSCTVSLTSPNPLPSLPDLIIGTNYPMRFTTTASGVNAAVTRVEITPNPNGITFTPTFQNASTFDTTASWLVSSAEVNAASFGVQATVVGTGGTRTCTNSYTLNIRKPRVTFQGRACLTTTGSCAGACAQPTGFDSLVTLTSPSAQSPVNSASSFRYSFSNIRGLSGSYLIGLASPQNWFVFNPNKSLDSNPAGLNWVTDGATYGPASVNYNAAYDFCVSEMVGPWWQASGGDVVARIGSVEGGVLSTQAVRPHHLLNHTNPTMTSGVAIGQVVTNISGETADWQVAVGAGNSAYDVSTQEKYENLVTRFQLGPLDPSRDSFGGANNPVTINGIGDLTGTGVTRLDVDYDDDSVVYYHHNGDMAINGQVAVGDNVKLTVFVNGNLVVNRNIVVPTDSNSFLGFVVSESITFGANVSQADGVFLADGSITVSDGPGSATVPVNLIESSRQFVGRGIFVGWDGVILRRDLAVAGGFENNQYSAERFIYRPDFIVNTPDGFKLSSVQWQEVAPGTGGN